MVTQTTEQAIAEIWAMFRETDRKFQETDRKFQETDRKFQETDRKFQETGRGIQETERILQESDRLLRQRFADTDAKINRVSEAIGRLGNRLGEFVESMVKPAVVRLFQERGIAVHEVHHDLYGERDGIAAQIDLLVVNDGVCVVVEVKSRLAVEDVKEHVQRLEKFKRLFPLYRDTRVHGAVAAMVIAPDVAQYAYRCGLYVLGQTGDSVALLNPADFQPTAW